MHDAQMAAGTRRLEMERQVAVVALARDDRRARVEHPDVGHVGALLERARRDVGRRAVEQDARASLRIIAGHDAADRSNVGQALLRCNKWKSDAPAGIYGFLATSYMSLTTSTTPGLSSRMTCVFVS